jgi:RNA polymerase sigma-B factor
VTGARQQSRELFDQLVALDPGHADWAVLRERLVGLHLGLAYSEANRFARRGEPEDDLTQVALVGLLKAIDRYDPSRGTEFSTFATPTIRGEIRRYFRDSSWALHVPRGLRELAVAIPPVVEQLSAELQRSPRPSEIAVRLGVPTERLVEALEAADSYSTVPLEVPVSDGRSLAETMGAADAGFERVREREALRPLLQALPERERTILRLRFFEEMSQSQIAAQVGLSQMHVSRLLARTLASLRERLVAADSESPG